jgi:hypothetical protein
LRRNIRQNVLQRIAANLQRVEQEREREEREREAIRALSQKEQKESTR